MPFILLDDGFWDHPKTLAAGNEAAGAYARALSWAGGHPTDGHVPLPIWEAICGRRAPKVLAVLHEVGFLDDCDYGPEHGRNHGQNCARIHDFTDINRTASEVHTARKAAREKKARWRAERRAAGTTSATTSPGQGQVSPQDTPGTVPPNVPGLSPSKNGDCPPNVPHAGAREPSPSPSPSSSSLDGPLSLTDARDPTADHQQDQTEAEWAEALTFAAVQLRHEWTISLIKTAITKARKRAGRERTTVALLAIAGDPTTKTPHRVLSDGWWWDENDSRYQRAIHTIDLDRIFTGEALASEPP